MRICFYCDTIFSFGGVQKVLAIIAKALSAKHDVVIMTHDDPEASDNTMYGLNVSFVNIIYLKQKNCNYLESIPYKAYSYIYKKKIIPQNKLTSQWYGVSSFPPLKRNYLIQTLNEQNFDIIVGVHAFLSLNLASIRHKLNARKVIGWMHTSFDAFFNTPGFYLWEQKNQFRHEMRKLDEIIVLSKNDCALYKSSLNLGSIPIYNPITIEAKNKYINNKKFLAIGRMSPKTKGFDILIKAFSIFAQNNTSWTLDIVGEGPEELYLRELIKENNLEQRVIIHPFTNDIGYYYSNASVYILSSRWEGLPLVLIEAMAFGLPIIASSISIVKEIISQSKNTFVFENENIADLADKLKHISLLSEEELEIMSQASITLSSNFEITSITNQWENIFNSNE